MHNSYGRVARWCDSSRSIWMTERHRDHLDAVLADCRLIAEALLILRIQPGIVLAGRILRHTAASTPQQAQRA